MIRKEEVYKIGVINKPHGVKGEVSFTFTDDIFDRVDCDYLILMMDAILVPFFIEEYRFRSENSALVKFEDIDTAEKAKMFTNVEVFFPMKYVEEQDEVTSWNYFVGFDVDDINHGKLGKIIGVDDSTINVLFVIEKEDGSEVLLPAHEEFILDIDHKKKCVKVEIPDGLLE